jgi:hypothetical protein
MKNQSRFSFVGVALLLFAGAFCSRASALVVTGYDPSASGVRSWTEGGTFLRDLSAFHQPMPFFETYDGFAVDPHRRIVYLFGNTLGEIKGVPFALDTGAPLFTEVSDRRRLLYTGNAVDLKFSYEVEGVFPPPNYGILDPKFSDDILGRNVLESIRFRNGGPNFIESINADTGAVMQQVDAPGARSIALGRGANAALYASGNRNGIYIYDNFRAHSALPFTLTPRLLVPDVTGEVDVAPDNSLLVNIGGVLRRYDGVTGADLGVFLDTTALGGHRFGTIEFGPNGDLYVLSLQGPQGSTPTWVQYRLNGQTGAVISSFTDPRLSGSSKIVPLGVPEPGAFSLAVAAILGLERRRRVAVPA